MTINNFFKDIQQLKKNKRITHKQTAHTANYVVNEVVVLILKNKMLYI